METKLLSDHAADLLEAAALLQQGKVVGIPTETVYGLAADARNPEAVRQIFAAKGRPAAEKQKILFFRTGEKPIKSTKVLTDRSDGIKSGIGIERKNIPIFQVNRIYSASTASICPIALILFNKEGCE